MDTERVIAPADAALSDEELRQKLSSLKQWTLVRKLIIPLCGLGGFACLALFAVNDIWLGAIASIVGALALMLSLFLTANKRVITLKDLMGKTLTLPILSEVFEVKEYAPNKHIPGERVAAAGLIYNWEKISGSDYLEGRYKRINIQYSDLLLEHEEVTRDSEGHKETKNVIDFMGQWMICDFGKELAATLRLIERKGGTKWNRTHDVSKSSIETENIAFNKKFRIITEDGHTAFYLLTPHFMERLVAADEAADASTLFCFMDGKVHIALYSGRDSFELKGVKLDSVDSVRRKFRRELKYVTDIMDALLLNDRLFKEG